MVIKIIIKLRTSQNLRKNRAKINFNFLKKINFFYYLLVYYKINNKNKNKVMEQVQREQIIYRGSSGTWSIVSGVLPGGIELDAQTGELFGEPTEYGEFPVTFKLTNRCGVTEKEVVVISCNPPEILSDEIIFTADIYNEEDE